jgi:lipoprotein-anchoring transpeptidase ErfK/SrfK
MATRTRPSRLRRGGKAAFYAALAAMMLEAAPAVPAHDAATVPVRAVAAAAPQPQLGAPLRIAARPAPAPDTAGALTLDVPLTRELPIREWLRPGQYAWDEAGAAPGPLTIVVNIRGRVLSAYRSGVEIGRSSLIYGADEKPTPHGEFRILEKDIDHKSNLYGGAPMPFAMRLTQDGVFLHASEMADDLATHGCVGLPKNFARLLFRTARVGDRVVIWGGTAQG